MLGCLGRRGNELAKLQKEKNKEIEKSLAHDKKQMESTHSLLLLGEFLNFTCMLVCVRACKAILYYRRFLRSGVRAGLTEATEHDQM